MLDALFERNAAWVDRISQTDPEMFSRLSAQQTPEYFWIGCSDSRVPANVVAGLDPGEVFVHRNVANIVHSSDLNLLSALEFAVDALGVSEIIICGHYGCGGVRASCEDISHGLVDHWIEPIRRLTSQHWLELEQTHSVEDRLNLLAELNVRDSVRRVAETPVMRAAWRRGSRVRIHGLIYGISDGLLRDLECSVEPHNPLLPEA